MLLPKQSPPVERKPNLVTKTPVKEIKPQMTCRCRTETNTIWCLIGRSFYNTQQPARRCVPHIGVCCILSNGNSSAKGKDVCSFQIRLHRSCGRTGAGLPRHAPFGAPSELGENQLEMQEVPG